MNDFTMSYRANVAALDPTPERAAIVDVTGAALLDAVRNVVGPKLGATVESSGSTRRSTWCTFPPDFDYVVVVPVRLPEHDLVQLGHAVLAECRTAHAGMEVYEVGPSSDVIDIRAHVTGAPIEKVRMQVTVQTITTTVAYERSFRDAMESRLVPARLATLGDIRLLKRILAVNGIYGVENAGLPGHVAEQMVLQLQRDPADLGDVMTALATLPPAWRGVDYFRRLPRLEQPGAPGRDMWAYASRFGLDNADRLSSSLRGLARRYLDLAAAGRAWMVDDIVCGARPV